MSSQQPNLTDLVTQWWGGSYADYSWLSIVSDASNFVAAGGNPPFGANEFFAFYPQFAGTPLAGVTASMTANNSAITVNDASALGVGMYVSDAAKALAPATYITAINGVIVTVNNPPVANVTSDALIVYPSPIIPLPVLQVYINLANACLNYNRWLDKWYFAMCLFIAHYCTLWLQSQSAPGSTPGQIAAQGLYRGILSSKAAGDVSAGYDIASLLAGFEGWGSWMQTGYGMQLITEAKIIGWGASYEW